MHSLIVREGQMKEIWMVVGFGAGLVTGALLYKHCEDAKKLVNKGEKAVKQEVENLKEVVKTETKKKPKQTKNKTASKQA